MGKSVTKVPNGPLVKKNGNSLRQGGKVRKAQNGDSTKVSTTMTPYMQKRAAQQLVREANIRKRDSILQRNANVAGITREELQKQQAKNNKKPDVPTSGLCTTKSDGGKGSCTTGIKTEKRTIRDIRKNGGRVIKKAQQGHTFTTKVNTSNGPRYYQGKSPDMATAMKIASFKSRNTPADSIPKAKVPKDKLKAGGMIKRADGSYSKRGLWDNIRANKGSGKKPTKQMLQQEKKIKAKSK